MNYLKSTTDAVLQSTGVSFPFSIGERIPGLEQGSSIWEIREGVKKVRLAPCLVHDPGDCPTEQARSVQLAVSLLEGVGKRPPLC